MFVKKYILDIKKLVIYLDFNLMFNDLKYRESLEEND